MKKITSLTDDTLIECHICVFPSCNILGKYGVIIMENKIDYDFDNFISYDVVSCDNKLYKNYNSSCVLPQGYFSSKNRAIKYANILRNRLKKVSSIEILDI